MYFNNSLVNFVQNCKILLVSRKLPKNIQILLTCYDADISAANKYRT